MTALEVYGQLHAPATLLLGKCHQYATDRRLDGFRKSSGRDIGYLIQIFRHISVFVY
jgi:hypothetical protein